MHERATDVSHPAALGAIMMLRHNLVRSRELIAKAFVMSPEIKAAGHETKAIYAAAPIVGSLTTLVCRCIEMAAASQRGDPIPHQDLALAFWGGVALIRDGLEASEDEDAAAKACLEGVDTLKVAFRIILEARWPSDDEMADVEKALKFILRRHLTDAQVDETSELITSLCAFATLVRDFDPEEQSMAEVINFLLARLLHELDPGMSVPRAMTKGLNEIFEAQPAQRMEVASKTVMRLVQSEIQDIAAAAGKETVPKTDEHGRVLPKFSISSASLHHMQLVTELAQGKFEVLEVLLKQCGVHLKDLSVLHDITTVLTVVRSFVKRGHFTAAGAAHAAAAEFVDAAIDQIFDEFADPSSNKITFTTYKSLLKNLKLKMSPHAAKALFAHADEDNSGAIDRHEFKSTIKSLQIKFRDEAMHELGLSQAAIVGTVLYVLFMLLLFLGFLMIGVVMLADGTTFTSVITGFMPGLGKAVGFVSNPAHLELLVHRGIGAVSGMFSKLSSAA